MGVWSRLVSAFAADASDVPATGPTFAIDASAVPPELFGLTSYETAITPEAPVSRAEAIQVPAVARARQMICGTLGRLPLFAMNATTYERTTRPLLDQPERDIPRSITMTMTAEDMLFHGVAWWRITERDFIGRPTHVRRLDASTVGITPEGRVYIRADGSSQGVAMEYPEDRELIRFDSPHPDGLLRAGARAIRTCARLDAAASSRATSPLPTGYFTTADGLQEPLWAGDALEGESEAEYAVRAATAKADFLSSWATARQGSATAFIPAGLVYNVVQESARDTQLAEERQHAVLEIGRVAGLDAYFLNASPAGQNTPYSNAQDKQRAALDTVAEYMTAIQDRLSMEDVTPRGTVVRFDTTGFLQADEKTRMETYVAAREAGAYGPEEVRRREELPADVAPEPTASVTPLRPVPSATEPVAASVTWTGLQLSAEEGLAFGFAQGTVQVDRERRTITGLAVPYGVTARHPGTGRRYQFSRGSLVLPQDVGRVKLLIQHDMSTAVGRAIALDDREDGLWPTFKVARGPEGDRALQMAEDGVWDGLSIGAPRATEANFRPDAQGVLHAVDVPLDEISLTPIPVFTGARVTAVAASVDATDDTRGPAMSGTETGTDTTTPAEAPAPTEAAPVGATFSTDQAAQFAAFQAWQAAQGAAEPAPETFHVPAAGRLPAGASVTEPSAYRFDVGQGVFVAGGQHDFGVDLKAYAQDHDRAAKDRVFSFMAEHLRSDRYEQGPTFDIDTTDVAAANPSRQRPDLFVDQRSYQYPLWTAVRKETLTDVTPLVLPKYSSSSGLVAAHVQGTEPASGSYALTSQTVTPGALSGKVEITREVWDQVGNPRVSNLIWNQMVKGWNEALEAKVVTTLNAEASNITDIALTAGASGAPLSRELGQAFVALQYIRGGFSMDTLAVQIDLFKSLQAAETTTGEPLFPILGPTNRNGSSAPRYARMDVHGVAAFPAWALAATGSVVANSWLFERESIYGAASTPERLEFQYRVAYVDLAIWGYAVCAVLDTSGVRQITYDPVA